MSQCGRAPRLRGPANAYSITLSDKKCPFTGNVSIRGRILTGVVKSTKMNRTIIIRRDYLHFIPKYRRYEKRHKNLAVHCSPAFRVEVGDQVTVGQCRPLSKTVRFNVLRVLPNLRVSRHRCACLQDIDDIFIKGPASFQEVLNAFSRPPEPWIRRKREKASRASRVGF